MDKIQKVETKENYINATGQPTPENNPSYTCISNTNLYAPASCTCPNNSSGWGIVSSPASNTPIYGCK